MAFYPSTDTKSYIPEDHYFYMNDRNIDPNLQDMLMETNSSVQRFLSDSDQSPTLFDANKLLFSLGVNQSHPPFRQISPPRTSFSCSDSCASPPQETDYTLPPSPPLEDSISPFLHHMDHNAMGGQLNHYGSPGVQTSPFGPSSPQDAQEDPAGLLGPTFLSGVAYTQQLNNTYWRNDFMGSNPGYDNGHSTSLGSGYASIGLEDDDESVINVKTELDEASPGMTMEASRMPTSTRPSSAGARRSRKRSAQHMETPPAKRLQSYDNIQSQPEGAYTCEDCNKPSQFKDEHSLLKHRKTQHTRPYICVYHFAGCTSTFATKNEWKRHVTSQHIFLHYWICTEGPCAKVTNDNVTASHSTPQHPPLPLGTIFNRKDLYTQHLRRMHVPAEFKKQMKQKNNHIPEWEKQVKTHQKAAIRSRCDLPEYMECPLQTCTATFSGSNAWDDRMEHVARHLDVNADDEVNVDTCKKPELVEFGGESDRTLLNWSARPDVAVIRLSADGSSWELNNPLRTSAGPRKPSVSRARRTSSSGPTNSNSSMAFTFPTGSTEDQDAEGEYDDGYVY